MKNYIQYVMIYIYIHIYNTSPIFFPFMCSRVLMYKEYIVIKEK